MTTGSTLWCWNTGTSTHRTANPAEEMALPLQGKKSNFSYEIFFNYFGKERLGLTEKVPGNIEEELRQSFPEWWRLVEISF